MHVKSKMKRKCSTANAANMKKRTEKTRKSNYKMISFSQFFSSDMQCGEGVPVVFQNCWKNPRMRKKIVRIYDWREFTSFQWRELQQKEAAQEVPRTSCAIRVILKRLNVWRKQKRRTDLLCICSHVSSDLFLFTVTRISRKWCRSARIALHVHEAWETMSSMGRRWGC